MGMLDKGEAGYGFFLKKKGNGRLAFFDPLLFSYVDISVEIDP